MVFKIPCVLVLWTKVASVLEGLRVDRTVGSQIGHSLWAISQRMILLLFSQHTTLHNVATVAMTACQSYTQDTHTCTDNPLFVPSCSTEKANTYWIFSRNLSSLNSILSIWSFQGSNIFNDELKSLKELLLLFVNLFWKTSFNQILLL